MTTPFQSKYWATQLSVKGPSGSLGQLSRSISNARVDLNPHQVDAALFAVRSPLSKGVVLADEVGLGKTIEAGLVLAQRWAERRRRILIIVPATLRKQWAQELDDKFHIPAIVLESASFNRMIKAGKANPFDQEDRVVVCSYHFAANKSDIVAMHPWDLVVIDEAHRLRNVYKKSNKMARTLRDTLQANSKVLLTATPLQNTLMELYGLVSFIDPHIFGDEPSYRDQFVRVDDEDVRNKDLRRRLAPVCHRTLRRQVLEYIKFTQRIPLTWEFYPTEDEQQLYEDVSAYLQREALFALPRAQRKLMTMVLRKLLASSSFAIAGTLRSLINRLEKQAREMREAAENEADELVADYEGYDETRDEWEDNGGNGEPDTSSAPERDLLQAEIDALKGYLGLAERISHNAKGNALIEALSTAFGQAAELGGAQKAVIFTESQRTQAYLFELLERSGYEGKVVILNGTNADQRSKDIYKAWRARHEGQEVVSGSRPVDVKAAIVEEFRERATILVADRGRGRRREPPVLLARRQLRPALEPTADRAAHWSMPSVRPEARRGGGELLEQEERGRPARLRVTGEEVPPLRRCLRLQRPGPRGSRIGRGRRAPHRRDLPGVPNSGRDRLGLHPASSRSRRPDSGPPRANATDGSGLLRRGGSRAPAGSP